MKYNWNPEQEFTVTGAEMALINALIQSGLSNPLMKEEVMEAQRVINNANILVDSQKLFQKLMEKGVEDGIVTVEEEEVV